MMPWRFRLSGILYTLASYIERPLIRKIASVTQPTKKDVEPVFDEVWLKERSELTRKIAEPMYREISRFSNIEYARAQAKGDVGASSAICLETDVLATIAGWLVYSWRKWDERYVMLGAHSAGTFIDILSVSTKNVTTKNPANRYTYFNTQTGEASYKDRT